MRGAREAGRDSAISKISDREVGCKFFCACAVKNRQGDDTGPHLADSACVWAWTFSGDTPDSIRVGDIEFIAVNLPNPAGRVTERA